MQVLRRPWSLALGALLLAGCAQALPAENPSDATRLYFPGPLLAMPDGRTAYVVSTNFDQRFDAGWLTRIDLDKLATEAKTTGGSIGNALSREIKVPSLLGDLKQLPSRNRAYATHRGSGVVSAYDIGGANNDTLSCGTAGGHNGFGGYIGRTDCDDAHLFDLKHLLAERDDILHKPSRERLNDPLAMVGVTDSRVLVSYLGDPRIIALGDDSQGEVELRTLRLSGASRASYDALQMLSGGSILAAGRAQEREFAADEAVLSLFPGAPAANQEHDSALLGQHMFVSRGLSDGRQSERAPARLGAIAEAADGRLYVLSRGPEAVLVLAPEPGLSTRADANGLLINTAAPDPYTLVEAYPMPDARLTDLVLTTHQGAPMLIAASLERDALYFFDLSGTRLQLLRRLRISGRGPYRMLPVSIGTNPYLLVSTFYDHGLTAVDLSPTSASDFVASSFADATNPSHLFRP